MAEAFVVQRGFFINGPGRDINFTADNRLNRRLVGFFNKRGYPEHGSMNGNGHGIHFKRVAGFKQRVQPDRTIQE